jgi:hypothetical protein
MELILGVPAFLIGAFARRWWVVGIAVPVGVWAAYEIPLENTEGPPHPEVGLVVAGFAALWLLIGVAFGVFVTRAARR